MKKKFLYVFAIMLLCLPVFLWIRSFPLHTDIKGPEPKTIIPKETILSVSELHSQSGASALALVVVDQDSRWPDLLSVLKTIGIPVAVYSDFQEAKKHKVVFIYPAISGLLFKAEQLESIRKYVKDGGHLIATNVFGGGLQDVFGYRSLESNKIRKNISFNQQSIQFSSDDPEIALGSTSYSEAKKIIGTFEDGTAAIIESDFGRGHAVAIGFDLGDFAYLSASGRGEGMNYPYVNSFVNGIDPILVLIKSIYRKNNKDAVTLGTVPFDKELTLLMTHDVDFRKSVDHALVYARAEEKLGIKATFFAQTKYVNDFGDEIFFRDADIRTYIRIQKAGMEIGSHSVSHSRLFNKFELGTGEEKYPDYSPFNESWSFTKQGTLLGELRVSKFLLDQKLIKQNSVSFRAGELKDPEALPQALQGTGYLYDSSGTAGSHFTNFPVHLTYNRRGKSYVNVFRFPVTIEDESMPPLFERLKDSNDTCEKVALLKAVCTILVHPNIRGHKLDYVVETIKYWKDRAHFSTVKDFGDWWSVRDQLKVRVDGKIISIESVSALKGLPLELPDGRTKLVDLEAGLNKFDF
jgi:peptidoglycan/xylan/chitin deacetylase (PgdA/CDA1 family)